MPLKYNGVEPTTISYNGTELTSVKFNNIAVWGKPFVISKGVDDKTTISVTRTSSPNQNASIGEVSDGKVYYGDVIKITASASTGYTLSSLKVNGSNFTSGQQITVESNIAIVATSIKKESWNTVFEGYFSAGYGREPQNGDSRGYTKTINGLKNNVPTKITFNANFFHYSPNGQNDYSINNVTIETEGGVRFNVSDKSITPFSKQWVANPASIIIERPLTNMLSISEFPFYESNSNFAYCNALYITKIEQYY